MKNLIIFIRKYGTHIETGLTKFLSLTRPSIIVINPKKVIGIMDDLDIAEIGRVLGYDLFQFGKRQPCNDWPQSVVEGFLHAASINVVKKPGNRYINKYLQLRLNALRRHRIVDPQISPDLIQQIDVEQCPVTRRALTHGELKDTDWSVDRLNNDAAYAPHNLAVVSTLANRAKADRTYEEVYALSQQTDATNGLQPQEWLRLAALMLGPCFATRPRLAPVIPLTVPIPKQTVRLSMQQVQYVMTIMAKRSAGKNALLKNFKTVSGNDQARLCLHRLVDAVHQGLKHVESPWDVWLQAGVMDALLAWRLSLDLRSWAIAGQVSMQLAGARPVEKNRLQSWQLKTSGYFLFPGNTRKIKPAANVGSQKQY